MRTADFGLRIRRFIALAAVALFLGASDAFACPVCFGNASGPMADGVNSAVLLLLGVIGAVLCGFAAFFIHLIKRSRLTFGETFRVPGSAEERRSI